MNPETVTPAKYARKPFFVDAIQVTSENMVEAARWSMGEVRSENDTPGHGNDYVHVRVARPLNDRQTKAFPGDWILYAGTGFKVYTDKAFKGTFEPVVGVTADAAVQAEKTQPGEIPFIAG